MVIVLNYDCDKEKEAKLKELITKSGIRIYESFYLDSIILGLIGDTSKLDINAISSLDIVKNIKNIDKPFKMASRTFHPANSVIKINEKVKIGGGNFQMIAGPCSVESEEQICSIAQSVKESGAAILRGGAFKPRTSPYSFQGLHEDGIKLLLKAKQETGMPIVTEIMDLSHLPLFDDVDIIQVGARNMQNFELLKQLGKTDKPILLKRGLSSTLTEFLMSAEYILAGGNEKVILCERGIRTFDSYTRNTLDLSVIPAIKELSHLPIIIDPSHSTGIARYVKPMAMAGTAAGSDGIMIEVHNNPSAALSDAEQAVTPKEFDSISKCVNNILPFAYKG